MLEMQTKDNRKFTNQLPKWAIGFHTGLISFFSIIGLGLIVVAVLRMMNNETGVAITIFGIGVLISWLGWFCFKNLQKYLDYVFKIELRQTGYYTYFKDKRKNEEREIFLTYERMEYVLIGMDYQLIPRQKVRAGTITTKLVPYRAAKFMFYGKNADGQLEVLSFTHSDLAIIDAWIDVLQSNNVTILHTDMALKATPNNPEGIKAVPKNSYEGSLLFTPGSEAEDIDNIFYTDEQKKTLAQKTKARRKKGFYLTVTLALLQVIMIYFYFPSWDIEEGLFSEDSDEIFAVLFTVMAVFAIYIYKHQVRWYDPIKDMLILGIGIWVGTMISPATHPDFQSAVGVYSTIIFMIVLVVVYLFKLFGWIGKIKKEWKNNREESVYKNIGD
ncbi:hypothetical protein [Paenibacillus sp. Z3-2]